MKKYKFIYLIIISQIATGCSMFKLYPDAPPDDEISITWEEGENDQIIINYYGEGKKKDQTATRKQKSSSSKLLADTVSSGYATLLEEIDSWLGTPYGYGKNEKKRGTDCSGLTMEIYKTVYGIKLNRSSEGQVENTVEISKEQLCIGDLIFFNTTGTRISHVGIYIGNNKFVHSSTNRGVVINDLDEKYYRERYVRSGRVIR